VPGLPTRISPESPLWPGRLDHLADPPDHLWGVGRLELLARPSIAIVGARRASAVGREIARRLGRDLAAEALVVVSGMARGIDGAAHLGALEAGGATVAVLGCGIDRCYPPEAERLRDRLATEGLLVSEFEAGTPPLRHHFPKRNRIIAALAEAIIVVEGNKRSGSRITADHGLDLGRTVMAVPRDPIASGSEMPNGLIRDGAVPVTCARDVLEAIGRGGGGGAATADDDAAGVPDRLLWLLRVLEPNPMGIEEIAHLSARGVADVLPALLDLELRGHAERVGLGLYRRRKRISI
jgi:DNA processing protein